MTIMSTTNLTWGYDFAERMRTEPMTLELLHAAVDNTNPDGYEGIPFSDGMRWISRNTQAFLELLRKASCDVAEFFELHLHNSSIVSVLWNDWLLLALGNEEQQLDFITKVFLAGGSVGQEWLKVALRVGITKAQLAEMVLRKLREDKVEHASSIVNFTKHDFVEGGAGRIWENTAGYRGFEHSTTYWSVLSDEQLVEACRIIIGKYPNLLFGHPPVNDWVGMAEKLVIRLGDEQVNQLLEEAADLMENMGAVNLKVMGRLPLDAQLRTARRLRDAGHCSELWVANMAMSMGSENGGLELLKEFEDFFSCDIRTYQWWSDRYERLKKELGPDDLKLAKRIDTLLCALLDVAGWTVGVLCEDIHRGRRQLCVKIGRHKYVKDRHQTTYRRSNAERDTFPVAGDVVAFRKERAYSLVPGRVSAVSFTLLQRPSEQTK